jgi:hypothetical protein
MKTKKNLIIILMALLTLMTVGCIDSGEIQEIKITTDDNNSNNDNPPVEETQPVKGSYKNPAILGETIVLLYGGNTYEVSVNEVIRGERANDIIMSGNMFNSEPTSGYEYILANVQVAYTDGDGSKSIGSTDFTAFSEGVECERGYVVLPNNYKEITSGDVMPGGVKKGWLVYMVPQNKEVLIAYKPNMFSDNAGYINIGT